MHPILRHSWFAIILLASSVPPAARANPELYERTLRGTAWVISPQGREVAMGTAVLLDAKRRLMLTNYHVVEDRPLALVFFPAYDDDGLVTEPSYYLDNSKRLAVAADVVATDPGRDLALLRLAEVPKEAREVPLAARSPRPGETVHALGNSGIGDGVLWRYGKGEVRQVYRHRLKGDAAEQGGARYEVDARVVETQVPSNPGDSGGPVVNDRGELVGITEGGDLSRQLVTFAIDVSEIRLVLARVKDPDPASVSLVGGVWVRTSPRTADRPEQTRLKFRPDGTFLLATLTPDGEDSRSVEGDYTLAGGRLVLKAEGRTLLEVTVRWVLDDAIVLSTPGGESRWARGGK